MSEYVTKDSGKRAEFSTGMVRDTSEGKARYDLLYKPVLDELDHFVQMNAPVFDYRSCAIDEFETWLANTRASYAGIIENMLMLEMAKTGLCWLPCWYVVRKRWAELMARGAEKYGDNNWQKAKTEEELARFRQSVTRHFYQWLLGEQDEDHFAAVLFNITCIVYVQERIAKERISKEKDRAPSLETVTAKEARQEAPTVQSYAVLPKTKPTYGVYYPSEKSGEPDRLIRTFPDIESAMYYAHKRDEKLKKVSADGIGRPYRVAPAPYGRGLLDPIAIPAQLNYFRRDG